MLENEEINGYWFLPTKPESPCFGQLKFGPLSIRLILTATHDSDLSDFSFGLNDYVIWGRDSKSGDLLTLFDCNKLDTGRSTSTFNSRYILFGRHIATLDAKEFDTARFSFENFEEWVGMFGHKINVASGKSYNISYEMPASVDFEINDAVSGCFTFWNNIPQIKNKETILVQEALIKMVFAHAISLDELLAYVWKWQQFITLMMFEQTRLNWIFIQKEGKEYRVFYRQNNHDIEHDGRILFLLPFRLVKPKVELAVKSWFRIIDDLNPIIAILHANIGESKEFVHNNFLNIVQAVEAFHRRKIQKTEKLKADNKILVSRILENIANAEDKEWLSGRLAHSYEPTLKTRLTELINHHTNILFVDQPELKKVNKLIRSIVDKRNYFTHYDPSYKKGDEIIQLIGYTNFLKMLLTFSILEQIGFDGGYLSENIYKRYRINLA